MVSRKFPTVVMAVALLAGCGQSAPRTFTAGDADRLEVADVNSRNAINRVNALESRVSDLNAKLEEMRALNHLLASRVESTDRFNERLSDQVVKNANVANSNAVRDMTRRGACGVRWVQNPNPGYGQPVVRSENIPCTEKDLAP